MTAIVLVAVLTVLAEAAAGVIWWIGRGSDPEQNATLWAAYVAVAALAVQLGTVAVGVYARRRAADAQRVQARRDAEEASRQAAEQRARLLASSAAGVRD